MLLLLVGCYSYRSIPPVALEQGARIALDLTPRAMADYEQLVGAGVERIEGIVAARTTDSLRLQVLRTRIRNGGWTYWSGESVILPEAGLARVQERRFSATRTSVAIGVVVAGIVQVLRGGLFGLGDRSDDPNPRPDPIGNPG